MLHINVYNPVTLFLQTLLTIPVLSSAIKHERGTGNVTMSLKNKLFKQSGFLSRLNRNDSGNVSVLLGLAAPMLVGGMGFGVDTAQWYLWKRELQYAVDQAALAGAYTASKDERVATENLVRAQAREQFAENMQIQGFSGVPVVTIDDYGAGKDNSVTVIANYSKTLPFSGMFLAAPPTISATAQAVFAEGYDYDSCIVATDLDDDGALTIFGSAEVDLGCGLAALSTSNSAVQISGNADINVTSIISAGGIDIADGFQEENNVVIAENAVGLEDPFVDLVPPKTGTLRTYKCNGNGNKASAASLPGVYTSFDVSCNTTMAGGVYIIDGGSFSVNAQNSVVGSGIMIVLRNGATISINGGAAVTLTAMTTSQAAAAGLSPRFAGILVIDDTSSIDKDSERLKLSKVNGNAATTFNGAFYLPNQQLTLLGSAKTSSQCLMFVANTIKIGGNASLKNFCPAGSGLGVNFGGTVGYVRLIS